MKLQTVHLFVFDGLADWEAGYAIAAINNPQFQKIPGRYAVRTAALAGRRVLTMGGIRIEPDMALEALSPADSALLILPGGMAWEEGKNMEALATARTFLDAGVPVAGICAATAALARAGLLAGRRHTSNSRDYLSATQYGGEALYEDAPAVTDANLITAPGTAPLDFAFHILRRLDLYTPDVLDAWYGLFKTGRSEYFDALAKAAAP